MMLPDQLHVGTSPVLKADLIAPARNEMVKPRGGLWTSSFIDSRSAWVEWCLDAKFSDPYRMVWHVLRPRSDARVIVINSLLDLKELTAAYSWVPSALGTDWPYRYLDFERIAENWDSIHLTEAGQIATHLSWDGDVDLYGWDCESTLWFRWCFDGARIFPACVR